MKNHKIHLLIWFTGLILSISCVNDNDYKTPTLNCTEPNISDNTSVDNIIKKASVLPTVYTNDDVLVGYVTSSDEQGNFYKTISFQTADKTLGFSIPVDDTNLYTNFEPGRKVFIKLLNNYFDLNYNSLRIGSLYVFPGSKTATIGRLSVFDYKKILIRSCQVINENDLVKTISISDINDNMLNTLIAIENVQFLDDVIGKKLYEPTQDVGGATNHLITDKSGKKLIVRTSSFASFKDETASEKSGTIKGVLTKYGKDYQLLPRYFSDIQMTEPRFYFLSKNYALNFLKD